MKQDEKVTINVDGYDLTAEEQEECNAIALEGRVLAEQIRRYNQVRPRGMIVFMAALDCIQRAYPAVFSIIEDGGGPAMIVHWVAAGKPDTLAEIPGLLLKRYGAEKLRNIEEEYANLVVPPEVKP